MEKIFESFIHSVSGYWLLHVKKLIALSLYYSIIIDAMGCLFLFPCIFLYSCFQVFSWSYVIKTFCAYQIFLLVSLGMLVKPIFIMSCIDLPDPEKIYSLLVLILMVASNVPMVIQSFIDLFRDGNVLCA